MNDDFFKFYPSAPDSDSKLSIISEKPQRDSLNLSIELWRRILPNKFSVQLDNREVTSYQCTALDAYSCIEAKITVNSILTPVQV